MEKNNIWGRYLRDFPDTDAKFVIVEYEKYVAFLRNEKHDLLNRYSRSGEVEENLPS